MRADDGALSAVDADRRIPHRDLEGKVALLPSRRARRERAINGEGTHREQVAFAGEQPSRDPLHELGGVVSNRLPAAVRSGDRCRDGQSREVRKRLVDRRPVLLDDVAPFLVVLPFDGLLDPGQRLLPLCAQDGPILLDIPARYLYN